MNSPDWHCSHCDDGRKTKEIVIQHLLEKSVPVTFIFADSPVRVAYLLCISLSSHSIQEPKDSDLYSYDYPPARYFHAVLFEETVLVENESPRAYIPMFARQAVKDGLAVYFPGPSETGPPIGIVNPESYQ